MTSTLTKKYATLSEAAEHLLLSTRTVRRMISDGELRAVRIGGSIRIPLDALAEVGRPIGAAR